MSAFVRHELDIRRGDMGTWYACCTGCPDWTGRPELSRPEAIRHHTIHALEATAIFA